MVGAVEVEDNRGHGVFDIYSNIDQDDNFLQDHEFEHSFDQNDYNDYKPSAQEVKQLPSISQHIYGEPQSRETLELSKR